MKNVRLKIYIFGILFFVFLFFTIYLTYVFIKNNVNLFDNFNEIKTERIFDSSLNWETYSDPDNLFSIKYPSSWYYYRSNKTYDELSEGSFVIFSSTLGNTSIQESTEDEEARLVVNILTRKVLNIKSWLEGSPLMRFDVNEIKIDGNDSLQIFIDPGKSDDGKEYIYLFLVTPKKQYSLAGSIASGDNMKLWREIIIKMQESIKFAE